MRDLTYPPIIVTAKLGFKALGLRFQMHGTEHVPREGGALLALNHISYVDFILGGFAAQPSKRLVRFMAKRELFDHRWTGPLMRSLHHIEVDRGDGLASYAPGSTTCAAARSSGSSPRPRSPGASSSRSSRPGPPGWPRRPGCRWCPRSCGAPSG